VGTNAANESVSSAAVSRVAVRVIRTDEELRIARSVCRALGLGMASDSRTVDHVTKYSCWPDPLWGRGVPP
jgi:hypothetical protein